jgi:hypothetical protein
MQRYTVYLYLETALHVSGGTCNHHQERIQLYLQHLVFVTPLLLSDAIVEELEPTGLSVLWVAFWRKSKHILCSVFFFSENCAEYEKPWKNMVEPDRPHLKI